MDVQSTDINGNYHQIKNCPEFIQLAAAERWQLVNLKGLCKGCLTPWRGTSTTAGDLPPQD
jgi:hypothetical protein